MKIVCMIPARAESSRIQKKCLRYLGNKPLVQHVIDTCKKIKIFDEIYLNSPNEIFREIANRSGIKFYKRDVWKKQEPETNDSFMYDFLSKINCDFVVQVNPTSPFIKDSTISNFTELMIDDDIDTLISTRSIQIESLFKDKSINFNPKNKMLRSQELEPISIFASSIFGFKKCTFMKSYEEFGYAMFGPVGLTKYYNLSDIEGFDIDYEEDFQVAEAIYESFGYIKQARYFDPNEIDEVDVPEILNKDGVEKFIENNKISKNIDDIINSHLRDRSWSERVINTESNSATLIHQLSGEGNRLHYHANWNEWWYIIKGTWECIFDNKSIILKPNDIISIPKNTYHKITVISKESGLRLAVSKSNVVHTYRK